MTTRRHAAAPHADPTPERLAQLRENPILAELPSERLAEMVRRCQLVRLRARRPFIREGDEPFAFCLLRGALRVFHRGPDGSEVLVKLFRPPLVAGEMECVTGNRYLVSASTLEECELLVIPAEVFCDLLENDHAFARRMAIDVSRRLFVATANERALAFNRVEERVAGVLLDYADLAGLPDEGGVRIALKISQQSLARDLGVSRRAISTALGTLRAGGLLTRAGARYVLPDLERLRESARRTYGLSYRADRRMH